MNEVARSLILLPCCFGGSVGVLVARFSELHVQLLSGRGPYVLFVTFGHKVSKSLWPLVRTNGETPL